MTGTLVNVATVVAGSSIGLAIGGRFTTRFQNATMKSLGLAVIIIGLQMALKTENALILLGSMALGAITGEALRIEDYLAGAGDHLKKLIRSKNDNFTRGFVTTTLLFCAGSMTILGCIEDGMNGNPSILYAKAVLDGFSAIALAAGMGVGVLAAAGALLVIQGSLTFAAMMLGSFVNEAMILQITSVGGLLIVAIGLNIVGATKLPVGNFLPAIVYAILFGMFF